MRKGKKMGISCVILLFSTRLETIIRFIKRYILMNKLIGNKNDKYAFMLLKEKSEWVKKKDHFVFYLELTKT